MARAEWPSKQDVAVTESAARESLSDAVALWAVGPTSGAQDVIAAAVDALVAGVDSPSLRELAGLSAKDDYWTLRPLVEATLDELDISHPGPDSDETQVAAARVMCRRLLRGDLTAREFVIWAHGTVGHDGAARLQPIVELDDGYDICGYTGETAEELDEAAHREARSLLAGEPLPPNHATPN